MFDKITHHFITAIFNRVATGFILCFSEHFRVRRGLGWNLNKLKTSDSALAEIGGFWRLYYKRIAC